MTCRAVRIKTYRDIRSSEWDAFQDSQGASYVPVKDSDIRGPSQHGRSNAKVPNTSLEAFPLMIPFSEIVQLTAPTEHRRIV